MSDLTYKIALSFTRGVNASVVRALADHGLTPEQFFTMSMAEILDVLGESCRFQQAHREEALFRARAELEFISRHSVRTLFLLDEDYPPLLREIPDAPVILYVLGELDTASVPVFSLVGTRRCTSYGVGFCKHFVSEMAAYYPDAVVVSGLAFGIDAAAHVAALESHLTTVAVVAHGLDMIYPAAHRDLARRILDSGGAIITEYPTGTRPLQGRFLERNRIVAGLSELTVVAESEVKGGAMSTANLAFSYSREVVALPGRYNDEKSSGCNVLIERSKAHIYISVPEIVRLMGWAPSALPSSVRIVAKPLFPELEGDYAKVYDVMRLRMESMSIDEIHMATRLSMPVLMAVLTELEFDGLIIKLPGARYELA